MTIVGFKYAEDVELEIQLKVGEATPLTETVLGHVY